MKHFLPATLLLYAGLTLPSTANAQGISATTSLTPVVISDPLFRAKKAFTVNIPLGWQFQGTVIAGLDSGLPSSVFRAYSPDGLTEIRLLPGFNWVVMQKSGWEGLGVPPEHIYLNETLTAAQFLDRYVHTLGVVHVVGPMSVGNTYQQQFDDLIRQMNTNNPKTAEFSVTTTGDATALRIETVNGTFTIEQRLRARVICSL